MNELADPFRAARFSQFGEDGVLAWLFHGRRDGLYVDIGCHHPFRFSNTALLHAEQGWSGINVDVDERATALFRVARPGDVNLTMGIAGEAGRRTVTIFEEGAINSFDADCAAHPAWAHIPRVTREVEVRPLGALLHDLLPAGRRIDLLNIDAEGLDVEILASNDWAAFKPEVVMVEVHDFDPNEPEASATFRLLRGHGYRLVSQIAVTSIYRLAPPASAEAPITDGEVHWLYKCLLGREPESQATVEWFKGEQGTFERGREYLKRSEEYRLKNAADMPPQYYIPEREPAPFVKSPRRLCLAAIVKDEALNVANMLRSCAPLLDHAVVVDTGSSDDTVAVVRATAASLGLPLTLAEVPFRDFAQARNAALERVPAAMDWILMLDADEEIVAADLWRFAALLEADDVDGWQLPRMTFPDAARRRPLIAYPDYQLRFFRNKPDAPVRFAGSVHEEPVNVARWGHAPMCRCETGEIGGPHIHHLGYMDITPDAWQRKHDFYTALRAARDEA